jgi:hypothetical protein
MRHVAIMAKMISVYYVVAGMVMLSVEMIRKWSC